VCWLILPAATDINAVHIQAAFVVTSLACRGVVTVVTRTAEGPRDALRLCYQRFLLPRDAVHPRY